jgi:hypothetical protein
MKYYVYTSSEAFQYKLEAVWAVEAWAKAHALSLISHGKKPVISTEKLERSEP